MTENDNTDSPIEEKKVFFLHPSAVIQNQIVEELGQQEFEVYIAKDENKLRGILKKYPDSVVFASINEGMRESAWEEWIRTIMASPDTSGVAIGVITSVDNEELRHKYTEQFRVRCGYIYIKVDLSIVIKQLTSILNSVNAKGRRKYLRVLVDSGANTTVNLPINGTFINGVIKDISVVGFSCSFLDDPKLPKNSLIPDMQIRLQAQLLKADGIVFGSRIDENEKTYVFLFTQRTSPDIRTRIRKYIQSTMQAKMDEELK